jgi:DNA-binding LytR/AlgR family response regulator
MWDLSESKKTLTKGIQFNLKVKVMQTETAIKITQEPDTRLELPSIRTVFSKGRSTAFIKLDTQKWIKIDFNDVVYVEAREKISVLFFTNGEYMICKSPLYKVQCMLPVGFERVHRAYIVNVQWIDFVDVSKKQVGLKNETTLALGLAYKDCIAKYFVNPSKYLIED